MLTAHQANQAKEAAVKAEAARKIADESEESASKAFAETEAYFKEVMSKPRGGGEGAAWFVNRELEEVKKYLPKKKGGTWKKKH